MSPDPHPRVTRGTAQLQVRWDSWLCRCPVVQWLELGVQSSSGVQPLAPTLSRERYAGSERSVAQAPLPREHAPCSLW